MPIATFAKGGPTLDVFGQEALEASDRRAFRRCLPWIHSFCFDDHRGGRRPKVSDESTCSFCLFAVCGDVRRIDHFPLHFRGERSYDIKAWVAQYIDQE